MKSIVAGTLAIVKGVLPLTREWIEISNISVKGQAEVLVLPLTREWIEIAYAGEEEYFLYVLPLTREWIEIQSLSTVTSSCMTFSLLRGSGLK